MLGTQRPAEACGSWQPRSRPPSRHGASHAPTPGPEPPAARPSLAEMAKRRPIQAKPVKAEAQKVIVAAAGPDDRMGRGYEREEALQAMFDAGGGRDGREGAQKVLRIPITAGATVAEVDAGSWYENSLVLKEA